MKKISVNCITWSQEARDWKIIPYPGYYAGHIVPVNASSTVYGYPLYIYKNPISGNWYIIDENTGASLLNCSSKKEAVQSLETSAAALDRFITKNPENYNRYCERFSQKLNEHLREINA